MAARRVSERRMPLGITISAPLRREVERLANEAGRPLSREVEDALAWHVAWAKERQERIMQAQARELSERAAWQATAPVAAGGVARDFYQGGTA